MRWIHEGIEWELKEEIGERFTMERSTSIHEESMKTDKS